MHDILARQLITEVTSLGAIELKTPEDVDGYMKARTGTALIFVNSVCGCAGGSARPALRIALQHRIKPDSVATVFASADREATLRARTYFTGMPPSSPSFALLKDGKLVHMVHRSDIEGRAPQELAAMLMALFDKYCSGAAAN